MENSTLEMLLMQFVRERESFSPENWALITSDENIDKSIHYLKSIKRDVESQFIACKTRVSDMQADCEEARRCARNVDVDLQDYVNGSLVKTVHNLPPTEAFAKFMAQEGRWKVKNVRFLSLIEAAISLLKMELNQTHDELTPEIMATV